MPRKRLPDIQALHTTGDEFEFGPDHPVHLEIPWINREWRDSRPITFPQLLIQHMDSNDPVPPEIYHHAKKLRDSLSVNLQREKLEIEATQKYLDDLKDRYETLQKTAFACDRILSPMRHIPNDIIDEIAFHCTPKTSPDFNEKHAFPTFIDPRLHTPTILSQVSRRWRSIAHGMSCLWQFICIDCVEWDDRPIQLLQSKVEQFCEMSQSQPLYLRLEGWNRLSPDELSSYESWHTPEPEIEGLDQVLHWILIEWTQKGRLTKLWIKPHEHQSILPALAKYTSDLESESWSSTRSVALTLPNVGTFLLLWADIPFYTLPPVESHELECLSHLFPNLRSFSLGQPMESWRASGVTFPSSLSALYLNVEISIDDWVFLLLTLPHLWWAYSRVHGTWEGDVRVPVVHDALKELTLTLSTQHDAPLHILRPFVDLRFPNISLLHLIPKFPSLLSESAENHADTLQPQNFLSVFPSLHTLRIYIPPKSHYRQFVFQSRMLLPLLLSVPSTVSFSIVASTLKQIVTVLDIINNVTMSNHPILPNLRQLSIGFDICLGLELRQIESAFIDSLLLTHPSTPTHVIVGEEANNTSTMNFDYDTSTDYDSEEGVFDYSRIPSNLPIQRVASLRIRSRMVGKFKEGRIHAFEDHLWDEYGIDIAFEVVGYGEIYSRFLDNALGLCADVPDHFPRRDWYTRYF